MCSKAVQPGVQKAVQPILGVELTVAEKNNLILIEKNT